jgi:thiol-disulfide isomerase/thioredoxin
VASSLCDSSEKSAKRVIQDARIRTERPGSTRYQDNHMSLIFSQGLSFSGFERNKVFIGQEGMRYLDVSEVSGADSDGDCRATVTADFDDDGDPDLFVNAIQRELHRLYRNDAGAPERNFIKVRLKATSGHPDAVGAIVKVHRLGAAHERRTVQAQVLSCGTGFEAQNAPELIFGLGAGSEAAVSVRWPGRAVEEFGTVAANGRYLLIEGSGKPAGTTARTFTFSDPPPPGLRLRVGEKLERLAVRGLDGSQRSLEVAGGKKALLNFWATTCSSCLQELPLFEKLHASGKYRVAALSLDPAGARGAVETLWKKRGFTFDVYLLSESSAAKLFDLDRLSIPLSVLIGADGRVERVVQGKVQESDF